MARSTRLQCSALAIVCLLTWPFSSGLAQTVTYKYGFCLGIAGTPPVNQITRAFALGPTGADLKAAFMQALGKTYGADVRRDATGCRMFATAAEAATAHDQVLDQVRARPLNQLDWLPMGATALPKAGSATSTKPGGSDSSSAPKPR